jgi:hypothetical protein
VTGPSQPGPTPDHRDAIALPQGARGNTPASSPQASVLDRVAPAAYERDSDDAIVAAIRDSGGRVSGGNRSPARVAEPKIVTSPRPARTPESGCQAVTAEHPCPICGKASWCTISADGQTAYCRRGDRPGGTKRQDKHGDAFWIYQLGGTSSPVAKSAGASRQPEERADPDTLNRVYRALLAKLRLADAHRLALRHRGLNDDQIGKGGYRTLGIERRREIAADLVQKFGVETCAQVPGLYQKTPGQATTWTIGGPAGLLIPILDVQGRVVALKVRADNPGDAGKYLYLSSKPHGGPGSGAPVHVPPFNGRTEVVRVTEGELKAAVATACTRILTISIPGVSSWRKAIPVLRELGAKRVLLALDADARRKRLVAAALRDLAAALVEAGLELAVETWDEEDGKGIDDLLVAGQQPTVAEGDAALAAVHDILLAALEAEPPPDEIHDTDLGNAKRLVQAHGLDLTYCEAIGGWHVWQGTHWQDDATGEAMRRAKAVALALHAEADADHRQALRARAIAREAKTRAEAGARTRNEKEDQVRRSAEATYAEADANRLEAEANRIYKWAEKSESEPRLKAMLTLAQSEPSMPRRQEEFDADPWLLTVLNGTVDLRTGLLLPHDRGHLITRCAPVAYDPAATCPQWEAFVFQIMRGRSA